MVAAGVRAVLQATGVRKRLAATLLLHVCLLEMRMARNIVAAVFTTAGRSESRRVMRLAQPFYTLGPRLLVPEAPSVEGTCLQGCSYSLKKLMRIVKLGIADMAITLLFQAVTCLEVVTHTHIWQEP